MTDRALNRRSVGWALLLVLAVLGGARVAQGATYQAFGFNARELLLNAGGFGFLAATCSALVVDGRALRIARWGVIGGGIWVAAAALGVWLRAARDGGALTATAWHTGGFGERVYYLDTALIGALSALGTSGSLLGDANRSLRQRIAIWLGLALVAAVVASVLVRGVRAP